MRSRIILLALLTAALRGQPPAPHMTGYSPTRARDEQAIERQFHAIPSPDEEKKQHRYFTAEPHPAGSERNHDLALDPLLNLAVGSRLRHNGAYHRSAEGY